MVQGIEILMAPEYLEGEEGTCLPILYTLKEKKISYIIRPDPRPRPRTQSPRLDQVFRHHIKLYWTCSS
jgi:hypothetical protein